MAEAVATPGAAPAKPDPGAAGNRRLQGLFLDLAERLQPEVFLDIGANDGAASLAMRLRLPACEIHSFEANPQIQARHAPRLQAARIQSWNLAAAAEAGRVTIYVPLTLSRAYVQGEVVPAVIQESEETGKASLLLRDEDATYREVQVEAVTVDGFVAEHLGPARGRRLLLWIDVEGAADRVLAGAGATLDQAVAAMVEVEGFAFWKAQSDRGAVFALMRQHGFVPLARDHEYGDHQHNVLFVHRTVLDQLLPLHIDGVSDIRVDRPPGAQVLGGVDGDIPVLIPAFNTVTYVRDMVRQLRERGQRRIVIIDNASTYGPMRQYLAAPDEGVTVIAGAHNAGPRHALVDPAQFDALPRLFCLTDPDLLLNPDTPADFLAQLAALTERMAVGKAGLALDIADPAALRQESFRIGPRDWKIWEWEAQFWQDQAGTMPGGDPIYRASVDTTFALYNKRYFDPRQFTVGLRVAGRYTCRHRPWYPDAGLPPDEEAFYKHTARDS